MAWELHDARSAFPEFAGDWDRLNRELFAGHPFFDSRFVGPLLKHFSTGIERLCIYRNEGRVAGALILQPQGKGRWTSFRPSQAQVTSVLIDDATRLSELFSVLPGFAWTIELIAIDPRYSPRFSNPQQGALVSVQAYTIGIHGGLEFEDYWSKRSRNLRANLRRYFNRLNQEFESFRLTRLTDPEEMNAGISRFGTIESAGWKGKAGTAISPDNAQGAFYADVLRAFAASGAATVYELQVGDKQAASRLMIDNGQLSIILKTTYDEDMSRIAPGRIQLNRVIEDRLRNHPEQMIEFYTNATRDQKEWATFGSAILNIQTFRNPFFSSTFSSLKALRNSLSSVRIQPPPPEELQIGVCTDIGSLRATSLNVSGLAKESPLEASLDWFELLQRTVFVADPGIRYYYAATEKQVSALLPLRVSRHNGVKKIEAVSNFYTSLYSPLKSDDSDSTALKHLLARAEADHPDTHVMRFSPMDPDSPLFHELFDHLLSIGWIPFRFFCFGNWYLRVEKDWEDYLKHRSANLRSRIKRKTRRFAAEGGLLEVVADTKQLDQAIAAFQEVYSASWKIPEPYTEFVPSLIRHLASTGQLRLGIARFHGKPIAAQLWILTGTKASIYKVAYHEAFAIYSPGTVLTSHMLQHVIDRDKVAEVDFLIGDDDYKKMWMSDRRERWGIVAYNPRTFIGLVMVLKETVGHVVSCVRNRLRSCLFHGTLRSRTRYRKGRTPQT